MDAEKDLSVRADSATKDVERCFGRIKSTFRFVEDGIRMTKRSNITAAASTVIALHNFRIGEFKKPGLEVKIRL